MSDGFNLCNIGGMNGEYPFNSNAVRNAANGKGFGNARALAGDNGSFKNLNSFFVTLANLDMNLNGVTNFNAGKLGFKRILSNQLECIHCNFPPIFFRCS